jgi:hypothetical protein
MRVWQHEVLGDVKRLHVVLELFGSLVAHQARGEAGLVVNQEDRRIVFGKAVVTVRHILSFRLQRCNLPHSKRMAVSAPKPEAPGWRHLARPVWAEGDACAASGLSAYYGKF